MKKIFLGITTLSLILLTGCIKITTPLEEIQAPEKDVLIETLEKKINMNNKDEVISFIIDSLKEGNIEDLSKVISKEGVSFSPYSYIDTGRQITLKKEELKKVFDGETEYVRGSEDGTGDPILLTFKSYIKKYVYDIDFEVLAEKHYDNIVQRGNTINNIEDIYSGVSTVEYFVPGINPEYE